MAGGRKGYKKSPNLGTGMADNAKKRLSGRTAQLRAMEEQAMGKKKKKPKKK